MTAERDIVGEYAQRRGVERGVAEQLVEKHGEAAQESMRRYLDEPAALAHGSGRFLFSWRLLGKRTFEAKTWPPEDFDESAAFGFKVGIRNIRHDGTYIYGDLKVMRDSPVPERAILQRPRVNFTANQTISQLGKRLAEMTGSEIWPALMEELCVVLLECVEQKGQHTVVREVPFESRSWPFLLERMVPDRTVSCIMAHGGQGKTLTGDAIALALATGQPVGPFRPQSVGPVLLVDWENNWEFHATRLSRLCAALGLEMPDNIHHFKPTTTVGRCVDDIVEIVEREEILWCLVDSIGYAAGGELNSSEIATVATNALKEIPCATTFLAHVSKASQDPKMKGRAPSPIGSQFFWNGATVIYELKQQEQQSQDGGVLYTMTNPKANVGPQNKRPIGWKVWFEDPGGAITLAEEEISGKKPGSEDMPFHIRVADHLKLVGKASAKEVAFALGMTNKGQQEEIRKLCESWAGRGYLVKFGEGEHVQFAVAADGQETPKKAPQATGQTALPATDPGPESDPEEEVPTEDQCEVEGCRKQLEKFDAKGRQLCAEHAAELEAG